MGTDTPLAVLSDQPQLLFNYFKQLFAQVTNPPIDPIREELVMSLKTTIGAEQNLFDETPEHCRAARARSSPILTNEELAQIKELDDGALRAVTLPIAVPRRATAATGSSAALDELCAARVRRAIDDGLHASSSSPTAASTSEHAPIPSLLATAAVHHHLIREGTRTRCGLVVESGEPREVQHFAC